MQIGGTRNPGVQENCAIAIYFVMNIIFFLQKLDKNSVTMTCSSPFSPFTNVTLVDGRQATMLLENPLGVEILTKEEANEVADKMFI